MRAFGKWLGRILLSLAILVGGLWVFGPRAELDREAAWQAAEGAAAAVPDLAQIDGWLADREASVPALRTGAEKRVVWASEPGVQTPFSVVYVHGFSAAAPEIQPVPDRVAQTLGANLFFTRLTGHGRDGEAMAEARPEDWIADYAEAVTVGRALGQRVVVISTSTGGTLAALGLEHGLGRDGVAGHVFVSPNFRVNSAAAALLEWPGAAWWLPMLAGKERNFEPSNELHAAHWTTRYPSSAVFPMAAVVRAARDVAYGAAPMPALFLTSPDDRVVDPAVTAAVAGRWGAVATQKSYSMGPGDDTYAHVIAGDILSPGQTERAVQDILDWISGL